MTHFWLKRSELYDFTIFTIFTIQTLTISAPCNSLEQLIDTLKQEFKFAGFIVQKK